MSKKPLMKFPPSGFRRIISLLLLPSLQKSYPLLYDLCGVDERDRAKKNGLPSADFTIVYHLFSFERNDFIRLKVALQGEYPSIPSITNIYKNANWYEREVYDMFGIRFDGHPHLQRILMPLTWKGHPLRKEHPARATEMGPTSYGMKSRTWNRKPCNLNRKNGD